jgi:uncharacterized membrane protein
MAFLLWCVTDTRLKPEDLRNSRGDTTVGVTLSIVLVQIALWMIVFFFALPIARHLPGFFITGWRFPVTFFIAGCARWFALLMVLQYVWTMMRATGKTTVIAVMAALGSESAKQSLEEAPLRFLGRAEEAKKRPPAQRGGTGNSG